MRFFQKLRRFAVLLAMLVVAGSTAGAQGYFGLSVSSSANAIMVSNSLTYTINVTNWVGDVSDTVVTDTLPASVQFLSATRSQGVYTSSGNTVVFHLGGFVYSTVAKLTLTVRPTAVGFITNLAEVSVPSIFVTNTAAARVLTRVTNLVVQANLGLAVTAPTAVVIVNDLMSCGVSVTNSGPDAAPNVGLTNALPPGVILKNVLPMNASYTVASNNLIFNLGTLNSGASTNFQFTLQPTNAGVLNFSASVGASGVTDTNTANNAASTNITVINYLPGDLVAVTNSAQIYNPQNGLVEQTIVLSNIGTNAVAAVRVVVSGLLTNRLFNAVGTNSGNPFVVYSAPLATNQSVSLLLQFFALDYFPFTNAQMQAFAVPMPDLTPPPVVSSSTNLNLTRILGLSNGNMLIEFPSLTNRTYTVVYSDNVLFSNALIAPPSILASANRKQWVDYGPPTTVSAPTNSSARFYRVFLNP